MIQSHKSRRRALPKPSASIPERIDRVEDDAADKPSVVMQRGRRQGQNRSASEQSYVQALEKEVEILQEENTALKKQLSRHSKKHACPLCERAYNRSDGLYIHLNTGDQRHRQYAEVVYGRTQCEECGRKFSRWSDLKKHMVKHDTKSLDTTQDNSQNPRPGPSSEDLCSVKANIRV